jgi:hypothetical protein
MQQPQVCQHDQPGVKAQRAVQVRLQAGDHALTQSQPRFGMLEQGWRSVSRVVRQGWRMER